MTLDVLVRMRDMLSAPLRGLTRSLTGIANMARKIGVVGTAIAAISFMGPINEAAAFQQKLLDIAGTADLSGRAAFAFVDTAKAKYEDLALQIGQYSDTIAAGAGQMIAAGVDPKLIDASIAGIGRTATAANAEFADIAGVATSMLTTLQLPASQLDDAMAGLVVSGKLGAFELKDMARYFPTLTSQVAKFGVTGREAVNFLGSALQIARKGTADPAEAANNLKNFLSKILAPATVKNFKDASVDIEAVMQDAVTKGINPIEAVMQKISKLTGVTGGEIEKMMKKAKSSGLEGAEALGVVREQLEKIHGAGALGELFADQQVMDFLIPFLGNIDEYKRIKDDVAKATGAITDSDFETQMQGLNRQMTTFREIGSQAGREVGLAFGTWMPLINESLAAMLKWMRELDASTGGVVRQALSFAGAGVLVAAGLGVLGIVLPVVGAGLSVLMTLLGPVGLLLAGVALGANHIYKNWSTYGPRLTRLWDNARRGFFAFADGMRDRGRRILAAGRELADRYGPVISAGFASAWADVKAGARGLQTFLEGFVKGLDLKIDLSGLTIENTKVAAFEAIDRALAGIRISWEALVAFGSGVKPYIFGIGEDLGRTVDAVVRFGKALARIGNALGGVSDVDEGRVRSVFTILGDLGGGSLGLSVKLIADIANGIAYLTEKLADFAQWSGFKFDWLGWLPGQNVISSLEKLANVIDKLKTALPAGFGTYKQGETLPNGTPAGNPDDGSDRGAAMDDWLKGPPKIPANSNKRSSLSPAVQPATQLARVDVQVSVEGPGKVTSATSSAGNVKIATANTGRAVGRV